MKREPHYIGDKEYLVYYKKPNSEKICKFIGVCENFVTNSTNLNAFWNKDSEQMLLVKYSDLVGLFPTE